MNILFLVYRYPNEKNNSTLEKDLVRIFNEKGHECFAVSITEEKYGKDTYLYDDNGINVLKVKTGDLFGVNKIKKGITVMTMPKLLEKEILREFGNIKIDLIVAYTPFMANPKLVNNLKKHFACSSLMMMWDIFPQNAKDLGLMRNKFIFNYFKYKEKKMFQAFENIACNSEGNIQYVNKNYEYVTGKNIFLVRNCEYPTETLSENEKEQIRLKYGFNQDDTLCIFGGNMGVPQQLENLITLAEMLPNFKFVFVGEGTEKKRLENLSKDISNVVFIDKLARLEYEELLMSCDVGLISLNEKYTVPNFPIKVTGYIKLGIPIFAVLDRVSYQDLGKFIIENNVGMAIEAEELGRMKEEVKSLINTEKIEEQKKNMKALFKKEFHIENAYESINNNLFKKIKENS